MNRKKHFFTKFLVLSYFILNGSIFLYSQNGIEITGKITDEQNESLLGVNITVKGKTTGTISNSAGIFKLLVPDENALIIVSYLGFEPKSFIVGKQRNFNIVLSESVKKLDEVVVVGYGTMKKSDLTGSVEQVSTNNIVSNSQSSFQSFLQGKTTGVMINANSGDPSAGFKVEIRGANSLTANTDPLYVIDGIPLEDMSTPDLSNGFANGTMANPMTAINPNDIESIEILKDASATAIYGSRGANGVILITTKSGSIGAPKINFNYSYGISSISKKIKLLNADQYAELSNEAKLYRFPDGIINFTADELNNLPVYDHQSAIIREAYTNDIDLSISGGDTKTRYYISGQYYNQEGIILNTNLTRYNLKMNLERELMKKVMLKSFVNISRSESDGRVMGGWNGGALINSLRWAPTSPLVRLDGKYNDFPNYLADNNGYLKERFSEEVIDVSTYINNPLAIVKEMENRNVNMQIMGNIGLTYNINKYLTLNGKIAVTTYNALLQAYRPSTVKILSSSTQGYATLGNTQFLKMLYEGTLSFNRDYNRKHFINGVLGMTIEDTDRNIQRVSAKDFLQDITGYNAIQAAGLLESPYSNYYGYQLVSYLLRGNYHYDYKYYLTFSGRVDGSSKFARGHRWGVFPSIGASWRIHKEDFLKDFKPISEFKLRTSYGIIGNQGIPSYQTLMLLQSDESAKTNYNFGNKVSTGYAPVRIANKDLTWEETKQLNIGVDYHMFDNRLKLNVDIYNKITSNLLYNIEIPSTSGYESIFMNIGSLQNKGLEVALSGDPIRNQSFSWNSSFNISWNKNKVLKLTGKDEPIYAGEVIYNTGLYSSKIEVGKSIGQFYGYLTDGIWDDESILSKASSFQPGSRAGDRRYKDLNADNVLNADDRTYLGSALPVFIGGFNNNFQYKDLELSVSMNFSYGNKMFNAMYWDLDAMDGTYNASINALSRWKPITNDMNDAEKESQLMINQTTNVPRAGNYSTQKIVSDYFVEDASFIRCNNISLGYNINNSKMLKLGVKNLKVYASIQNLFTITEYQGYSPQGNSLGNDNLSRGIDNGLYPESRTYKFGVVLSL